VELVDLILAPYDFVNWLADQAFLAMKALYDRFGPPMVFFAALIEATVGLGVVFPGVVLIFLGGAFAGEQGTPVPVVLLLAVAGTILGDSLSYTIGRLAGDRLQSTRFGSQLRLGRVVIEGRARWLIPFYHLNSWTRAIGPVGAGALRLPLRVWVPLDYAGAIIANTAWVGAGWLLGQAVLTEDGTLEQHPALRIGLAATAVAWYVLVQRELLRSYRRARADGDGSPGEAAEAGREAEGR
jgi:undecaprenyl-diphosphatase